MLLITQETKRIDGALRRTKFPTDSMAAASRCLALMSGALGSIHSMCVLEHGLRWLGVNFKLTLSKPMDN